MLNSDAPSARGQRCLVLGGRGFIGSHLVASLLEHGYHVRCLDRPNVKPIGQSHLDNPLFELYEGDFGSDTDLAEAVKGCDYCYHLVSTTLPKSSNADPVFDVESNVVGTIRLLNHALENRLRKVIFVSSGGTVYGTPIQTPIPEEHPTNPTCSYGITKLAIEKYLALFHNLHGLDYTVLRLANPYGEGQRTSASQGAVAVFLGKALRGEQVEIWGDGSVVRDYLHVSDVIDALLLSLTPSNGTHVFNIGSGCGHSLNEVLYTIESVTKSPVLKRYVESRAFDVPVNVLNIDLARRVLGWTPKIDFATGIDRFYQWLMANQQALRS